MIIEHKIDRSDGGLMGDRLRHFDCRAIPPLSDVIDNQCDVTLITSARDAVAAAVCDPQRAAVFACFAAASGAVQYIELLQAGSLRDVAFYERQVVEQCFRYELNLVVLVFYLPLAQTECPAHLMGRLSRFSRTLHSIEMSMPYVIWKSGSTMQILQTAVLGASNLR